MNPLEEQLYETVALEISQKQVKPGLYAKAFSASEGDKDKAIALYIKLRVDELLDKHNRELEQKREVEQRKQLVSPTKPFDRVCKCSHRESHHTFSGFRAPCGNCTCKDFYMDI